MPSELERVQAGQPWFPSAPFHNAAVEAIRQVRQWQIGEVPGRNIYNPCQPFVRNDSETDRDQYDVLAIGDTLVSPATRLVQFKTQVRFSGLVPTYQHWGRICILRRPLKIGKIGPAVMKGLTPARIRVNHAEDRFAELSPDDPALLESCTGGGSAKIIWLNSGTGVQWGVVDLDYSQEGFGVEYAEDCPGRSTPFRVWVGRWDPATHLWDYDRTTTFWAIDHRYDVPYASKCGTGLAKWKPSDTYGRIAEIWVADCDSPGCYGYTP